MSEFINYSNADFSASLNDSSIGQVFAGELNVHAQISIANIETLGYCPDLNRITEAIHREPGTVLDSSLESVVNSFMQMKAVTLMDGAEAVGYVRYTPLLDGDKKRQLGLRDDFPDIDETGTAIILREYRGHHYYPRLRTALLSLRAQDMKDGKVLILGTTKSPKIIESLDDSNALGLEFDVVDFMEVENVSAHTCVCEGDFGNGFQNGINCPNRATNEDLIQIARHDWQGLQKRGRMIDGKIPCTLYLSNARLARSLNDEVREQFGSLDNLIKALKDVGHYEK